MEESILQSTKKILGVNPDDPSFDLDIITHINSEFSILHDLGVGPEEGFVIESGEEEWSSFLSDDAVKLSKVKACVYLRTRLLFDPPAQAFFLESTKELLRENEYRLSLNREATDYTDPPEPELAARFPVLDPNPEI